MIKINLVKKKKSSGFSLDLPSFLKILKGNSAVEADAEGKVEFRKSPVFKLILLVALCYLIDDTLIGFRAEELKRVDKKNSALDVEIKAVDLKLKKVKGFEKIKQDLEKDELTLRTKLGVMKKLLENRNVPAKMLLHISQVIPSDVWITDMQVKRGSIEIKGGTPGYNQVSDFLKALSSSAYFTEVKLQDIREKNSKNKDQRFQTFSIKAQGRLE